VSAAELKLPGFLLMLVACALFGCGVRLAPELIEWTVVGKAAGLMTGAGIAAGMGFMWMFLVEDPDL